MSNGTDALAVGIINRIKDSPEAMSAIRELMVEVSRVLLVDEVFPGIKHYIEQTVQTYLIENGFAVKES